MREIEVKILNPDSIAHAERMLVAMARMTQRGADIRNMADLEALYHKDYTDNLLQTMCDLPHKTLKRFGCIDIAIVGASRRFLAQITRHQAGVTFMSGSLQYSDYSGKSRFVVPYELIEKDASGSGFAAEEPGYYERNYLNTCKQSMADYEAAITRGQINNDTAGYMAPQGLRNVLVISANPLAWIHMIKLRTCNRNTAETQYVMLRCWEELRKWSKMFEDCGPACMDNSLSHICPEGVMSCGDLPCYRTPGDFLDAKFPLLRGVAND